MIDPITVIVIINRPSQPYIPESKRENGYSHFSCCYWKLMNFLLILCILKFLIKTWVIVCETIETIIGSFCYKTRVA